MSIAIRDDDTSLRQIGTLKMRDAGNTLRTATTITMRDANNVLRTIFGAGAGALHATAAPAVKTRFGNAGSALDIVVGPFTVTVTGGVAPYTYSWANDDAWPILDAASATTSFTAEGIGPGDNASTAGRCTVTDAAGTIVVTNDVTANATNLGGTL